MVPLRRGKKVFTHAFTDREAWPLVCGKIFRPVPGTRGGKPVYWIDGEANFYAQTELDRVDGERVFTRLHSLVMGHDPRERGDLQVDHLPNPVTKRPNRLDNRLQSLALKTALDNSKSRARPRTSKSEFCCVEWVESRGKWKVSIARKFIGYFGHKIDAARVADIGIYLQYGTLSPNRTFPEADPLSHLDRLCAKYKRLRYNLERQFPEQMRAFTAPEPYTSLPLNSPVEVLACC